MAGMTFKSVASSTLYFDHCSPRIPLLPETNAVTTPITGRDGVYDFDRDSRATRPIPVDCLIKASTEAELITRLAAAAVWLSGSGWLVFDHDATKRWWAKVYQGVDQDRVPKAARFTVLFECYPYAEDVNATTGTIGTAQDYGSAVEFYPVITVTKSGSTATSLQVGIASTGKYVLVTDSIAAGDVLVFNMETGKVTKNGTACMSKVSLDSLFFSVPTGTQTISVTTTSTYTAAISYRKRYLYA